ncbi:hypothetical protein Sme01_09400 [Sphaerisporangium melleum]|uniref:DUF4012 domain-containing protein n=1 Tax=Sphaerisporangium melleum TaxID=321316 RepID=A0A917VE15_9ACTN|nr:DUF4012 domain-containing protein [Sphaerisporangium melleum]GGK67541.1 hypothetical protein GCM10007964_08210 [Sphaerisporangium melleum]GII68464.1 hypothetical protein Sme01_09400 [Sphaerisporangium melleum]
MPASRRRRIVLAGSLTAVLVLVSSVAWSAHLALGVRDHLQATRDALVHLRAVMSARDLDRVTATITKARRHAAEARRLTAGPDWGLLTHLPVVGDGATTVRGLAESAGELTDVLAGVQRAGTSLFSSGERAPDDARQLLDGLAAVAPALDVATARLGRAHDRLSATPARTGAASVDQAREAVLTELVRLRRWVGGAADAAALIPPMLGNDGPRRYFLAFQTNAESRGTGGLVGAFGILSADHGRTRVTQLAANNDLPGSTRPVIDHGRAFRTRYGEGPLEVLSVSNLSPHFPYAAKTWTAMWQANGGPRLDGAIAVDPVALSYLLGLIGPVTLPGGEKVTAANVVDLTERAAYARYPDSAERKRFLISIARAVGEALPRSFAEPARLLPALKPMIEGRRLQIWSRHQAEQWRLAGTALGGVLPQDAGPYAALVLNNSAGGKLDYYLSRSLDYRLGPCRSGRRADSVQITLTNDVPVTRLPSYVTGRLDRLAEGKPVGSNLLWVSLYASVGAELRGASLDGAKAEIRADVERSHPVFSTLVELGPRQTRTLRLELSEPASAEPPRTPVQPLARPQRTRVSQDPQGCAP